MIMAFFRWLFGQRRSSESPSLESVSEMSHADAREHYERQRTDPAACTHFAVPDALSPSSEPVCPACGGSLGNRKAPSRRSSFKCKKCGAQLHADPHQRLFSSVYLTEAQASLVGFLWQLDHWVFTAGTWRDFCWAKGQIGKGDQPSTVNVVADTIWFLLNYNYEHVGEINPSGSPPCDDPILSQLSREESSFSLKTYRQDIRALIEEFRIERARGFGPDTLG